MGKIENCKRLRAFFLVVAENSCKVLTLCWNDMTIKSNDLILNDKLTHGTNSPHYQ